MYENKKGSFEETVEKVIERYKNEPLEKRNGIVEEICEAYVMEHGKKPDSYQLQLLADLILREDLTNPSPYKSQEEEFPFHSNAQRKRRNRKEFVAVDDTLSHMNYKVKTNLSTAPPRDILL